MENNNSNSQSAASGTETLQSQTPSDAELTAMLVAKCNEEIEHLEKVVSEHNPDDPGCRRRIERLSLLKSKTPECLLADFRESEERARGCKEREAQQRAESLLRKRNSVWYNYIKDRGKRYENCKASNFVADNDKQRKAIEQLKAYASEMKENLAAGKNVVLFGPSGTGKDHLVTALVGAAIGTINDERCSLCYSDGPSLFAAVRAEIGDDSLHSRDSIVYQFQMCWLVVLSDLVPPAAKLTDFQSDVVYRIVEHRYSSMLPMFLTINVRNRAELDAALGVAVSDRIIDDALTISCDWPSYRKSTRIV